MLISNVKNRLKRDVQEDKVQNTGSVCSSVSLEGAPRMMPLLQTAWGGGGEELPPPLQDWLGGGGGRGRERARERERER